MRFVAGFVQGVYWGRKGGRFKSRADLTRWQALQLNRQLAFLKLHCQYYAEYDQLQNSPLLTKQMVMENFDQLNTVRVRLIDAMTVARESEVSRDFTPTIRTLTVGLSTGTSGKRGLFVVSPFERGFWSGYILRRMLPRGLLAKERVALFLRAGSNLYSSVSQGPIQFRYFDLKEPIESLLIKVSEFDPTVLLAPPPVLRLLAEELPRLSIRPRRVISIADVLDGPDQTRIEAAFGQSVHQIYQATEGLLALTCNHGSIHLNEDLVYFEWESLGQGRFTPIITDLRRRSLPLVRYRLDDILRLSDDACPCGSVFSVISQIEGRRDHLLYGRSNNGRDLIPIYPDYIRGLLGDILDAQTARSEYHVRQASPVSLSVALENGICDSSLCSKIQRELASLFKAQGCQDPTVSFETLDKTDLTIKHQRITRLFGEDRSQDLPKELS